MDPTIRAEAPQAAFREQIRSFGTARKFRDSSDVLVSWQLLFQHGEIRQCSLGTSGARQERAHDLMLATIAASSASPNAEVDVTSPGVASNDFSSDGMSSACQA
ncbi:MAG: hypothetical protein H8E66_00210 [Planctomycetes bacterium]|nr:hypothetical protein [Planctomycetota bacterium]